MQQTSQRWTTLARILRPQGRRGEVLADLLTDFPERFAERKRLFLLAGAAADSPREIQLQEFWMPQGKNSGRIVFKFDGVDSIADAEVLERLDVAVPFAERAPLMDGETYLDDLIGCTVFDRGQRVGVIENVDRDLTPTPLLVVRAEKNRANGEIDSGAGLSEETSQAEVGNSRAEVLIPFAQAFITHLNLPERRLEMHLPEGLLELAWEVPSKSDSKSADSKPNPKPYKI